MKREIEVKKKQIEEGVSIYLEGLPGNPENPPEVVVKGLELFVESYEDCIKIHGWCGMAERLFEWTMPYLHLGDRVHVLPLNGRLEEVSRTYVDEFFGVIVMLEPTNGLVLVEDSETQEYRLVDWGRVRLVPDDS